MRMSFRTKVFLVLLVFSLAPMLLMRTVVSKVSRSRLGEASEVARQDILELMSYGLEETARGAAEILENQGMAYGQSARVLAMEALRLRGEDRGIGKDALFTSAFGMHGGGPGPTGTVEDDKYKRRTMSGRERPLPVNFGEVAISLASGVDRRAAEKDIQWLASLERIMRTIYEDLDGKAWWVHVYLASGVSAVYPAHGGTPPHFDPRQTSWYRHMRRSSGAVWSMPHVDPSSKQVVASVGHVLWDKHGKVLGVAVVDLLMQDILLQTMVAPEWGSDQKPFLLLREDHPETAAPGLRIIAQMDYARGGQHWMTPIDTEWLSSSDTVRFAALLRDVREKDSGTMRMPYRGVDSVWAFASKPDYTYLIIVPERAVAEIPDAIVGSMNEFFDQWRNYVGVGALGVILMAAIVGWFWARSSTKPLLAISNAARRIGEGDFDVRIDSWTGDERDDLIRTINEVGPKLKEHLKIRRDLELARTVQAHLLPKEQPDIPGWDISGGIVYCDQTGGDYYDYLTVSGVEGPAHAVVVGDVTGHGVPSALLMSSARALLHGLSGAHMPLNRRVAMANLQLNEDLEGSGRFLTLFYLQFLPDSDRIRWVRAGHDPAIVYHPGTDTFEELMGDGLPLGICPDTNFEACDGAIPRGSIVVIATDGAWEAHNVQGEMFGKERLLAIIRENADKKAAELQAVIFETVDAFIGGGEQVDDITVVVMRRTGDGVGNRDGKKMDTFSFRLTNKQKCFQIFRPKVEEFCRKHNFPGKMVFNLTLVLDELISNIISYGYSDMDEHPIDVSIGTDGTMIRLRIEDDAEPFNILEAPLPELNTPLDERDRQVGGMGIHIVKKLVNCLHYKRENGKNILTLEKMLNEECTC